MSQLGVRERVEPLRVVLIDDDVDDNFFHQRAVQRSGLNVHAEVFVDSFEGLARVVSLSDLPDLICVDLSMPKLDGWRLIDEYESARSADGYPLAPVVIVTSMPDPQTKRRVAASSAIVEVVAKPLTPETFRRLVAEYVQSEK